jgi:dCMP deaminase
MEAIDGLGLEDYNVEEEPNVSWDEHYFNICVQVSRNSKCLSRKIGAILVRDKRIISSGYNGPPEGIPSCDNRWFLDDVFRRQYISGVETDLIGKCPRKVLGFKSGEGLDVCPAVHAEANSVVNCARMGTESKGATMYMSCGIPCMNCMKEIMNAGVKEIVVTKFSFYDDTSRYLLENSEIKVRIYDFIGKAIPHSLKNI